MNRLAALRVLNPLLALLLVNQILSGALAESLPHRVFEILHQGGAVIVTIAVLLHVSLNGNWIKAQYFRKKAEGKG